MRACVHACVCVHVCVCVSFKEVDQGKHTCISADMLICTYHGIVTMDKTAVYKYFNYCSDLSANMRLAFHKDRDVKRRLLRLCTYRLCVSVKSLVMRLCTYRLLVSVRSLVMRLCTYQLCQCQAL